MNITDRQYIGMTISLAMLATIDLSENDPEQLTQLAELLCEAALNVARARQAQGAERRPDDAKE